MSEAAALLDAARAGRRSTGLWELIHARATVSPEAPFLLAASEEAVSFGAYRDRAERVATALAERGVGTGTPVSWMLPTCIDAIVLCGALARLGAVQNPVLPIYRERETRFVLKQTGARALFVPTTFRGFEYGEMARSLAADQPGLAIHELGALPEAEVVSLPEPPAPADAGEPRWVFYTSGTTSDPKGARHGDAGLVATHAGMARALDLTPDSRVALVFPVTHVGGVGWLIASFLTGCAHIVVPVFDPPTTIPLLARHGVTHAGAGTAFHQAYLAAQREQPDAPVFPRVRVFPGGGAPKPPELHFDVKRELGGVGIVSGYGLTECPIVAMGRVGDSPEHLARTEGAANPGDDATVAAEIRIVGPAGTVQPAGVEGEIRVRGPQLFHGYVDPSLDAAAFDEAGFFRTGDLGSLDAAGHLRVTGRLKDVIIRKGENISAQEVEDLLYTHPHVSDVAVIGLPDPELGERCCAVVACAGAPLAFETMVAFLKDAGLMRQKIPEQLEIVEVVPRNAAGKIEKQRLRERFGSAGAS